MTDENFPADEIRKAGFQVVFSGQKTYNGVAIISKQEASDIVTDVPGLDDPQRRILAATINGIRILDLYVVNGQEVGSEKLHGWTNAFAVGKLQKAYKHRLPS